MSLPRHADKRDVRALGRVTLLALLLTLFPSAPLEAYRLTYKEQLYELYHVHLYQYPERIKENIYWLEEVQEADFANPLHALARIENEREWEWYRYLFSMHVNLKLTELYLRWGSKYNKFEAYFYNYPWKEENLESLEIAESLFREARYYWSEAQRWSERASRFRWLSLEEIQNWEDEHHRIDTGELDYGFIIERHLRRLEEVRAAFEAMDETTY
ncbi:MAG: hypothetical protein ACLFPW_10265 [Spirochaetaceae bacterium]